MIVEYIKGSILDAPQKHIAHGVNCRNRMGSGVAKVLFTKYPKIKKDYHELCTNWINRQEDMLGLVQFVDTKGKTILNCFTQENFGYDGQLYVSYKAIEEVFKKIDSSDIMELAIPKIGCGLAGGDWDKVSKLIDKNTPNTKVFVYYL